jgi:fructose-1,6-bisphosphatase
MAAVQSGIKLIAGKVARAGLEGLMGVAANQTGAGSGDVQKKLDVVAVRHMAAC